MMYSPSGLTHFCLTTSQIDTRVGERCDVRVDAVPSGLFPIVSMMKERKKKLTVVERKRDLDMLGLSRVKGNSSETSKDLGLTGRWLYVQYQEEVSKIPALQCKHDRT